MHSRYDNFAPYGHVDKEREGERERDTRVRGRNCPNVESKNHLYSPSRMTPVLIIFKVKLAARL